jgi:hypothetical protein
VLGTSCGFFLQTREHRYTLAPKIGVQKVHATGAFEPLPISGRGLLTLQKLLRAAS